MTGGWFSRKKEVNAPQETSDSFEKEIENKTWSEIKADYDELFIELDGDGKARFDKYHSVITELMQQPENKGNIRLLDLMGALISEIEGMHLREILNGKQGATSMNLHIKTFDMISEIGKTINQIISALSLASKDIKGNTAVLMKIEELRKQGEGLPKLQKLMESMIAEAVESQRQQQASQNPLSG